MKKKIDYNFSLPYLIDARILTSLVDANWLIGFIFDVRWLGRKSHIIKMPNRIKTSSCIPKIYNKQQDKTLVLTFSYISTNLRSHLWGTKSSKQGRCYLVLLKVQYRSSRFWILWKTLSLDFRPKDKRIILNSKNVYNLLIWNKQNLLWLNLKRCCRKKFKSLKQNFAK